MKEGKEMPEKDGLCAEHPNREKIWVVMLINVCPGIDMDKGII
jgi:hypothetical protein